MKSISRSAIKRQVFLLRVEQLAHRQRHARLLPDQPEMVFLFRGQGVFKEEQVILFQLLAKLTRLARRDPLVDVVEQLDLVAERQPQVLEQLRKHAQIGDWLPDRFGLSRAVRARSR